MARLTAGVRDLDGRVAVVTGAASGMGRAIARLCADEGATVALLDRTETVADEAAAITEAGHRAGAWTIDLAHRAAIPPVVETVVDALGPPDILVNCAGVSLPSPLDADGYDEAWDLTLAVNLTAYVAMARACLPHLARAGAGRIVNIASTEGQGATPMVSAYTASKHGVVGLTRALAVELGRRGVTVNCVLPGPIRTGMTAAIPDDAKATFARRRVPVGRYGDPDEVAHAVVSLALPAMSFVNGAVLAADGGLLAQNT